MTGLELRQSERDLLAWTNYWIPSEILTGDEPRLRRARNLIVVVCGTLVAVTAGIAHLLVGHILLGILATSIALPAVVTFVCGGAISISEGAREQAAARVATLDRLGEASRVHDRTQEALVESQSLFSIAFQRAPSLLVLTDVETKEILDVNERFTELLGYTREEVLGKTPVHLGIYPEADARLVETARSLREGEVRVTDDGHGIESEFRSQVFDPFYTTRLEDGGSGLGLSVAHGILGDHDSQIEIEAAPTGGTCFRITIPIDESAAA